MEWFWILIMVSFFTTNTLDEAESVKVKLEETPLKTFDKIFGEGWWDKDEADDLKMPPPTNFGQNVHHQIDRQNTQIGQNEPNSTDQNPPLTESDHSGQIEPNSTDQNPPLTESDHSGNTTNSEEQNEMSSNENITEDERKRKIIDKFHAIKEAFKQKGEYSKKERSKIERIIAKHLKVNRTKIYEWKKEFGLIRKTGPNYSDNEKLKIVKNLMQMKKHFDGSKKSCKEIDQEIAERFGVNIRKINQWKKEFGLIRRNQKNSEQKELMKKYYEIKDQNPKIGDEKIAKMLNVGRVTLFRWKKLFKRQQFHPNSVDRHFVKVNAAANVQEIKNSNSESI